MAAEAIVSAVLEKLTSIALDEIEKEVRRVINVRREVDKLSSNFRAIKAVLEDAERQQLEKGKGSVRDWLDKLREVSYDIDDALDEWTTAILKSELESKLKVCSFVPSLSYFFNRGKLLLKTAHKIQALNERLDVIANERQRYEFKELSSEKPKREETTSFINVAEVRRRVEDEEKIVNMLLDEGKAAEIGSEHQMISIVGIGGIGKTTLAKLVFNTEEVQSHFKVKIWMCVSDTFNEMKIAKDILNYVARNADEDLIQKLLKLNDAIEKKKQLMEEIEKLDRLADVLEKLKISIEGKKFLLVLDDVWTEEYGKWDRLTDFLLSNGSQGSKILVTTRKENVARTMGCTKLYPVGLLTGEESWLLFSQIAFHGRSSDERRNLEEIGREIANKCKGLPLALKTLGSLIRLKKYMIEWQSVLESEVWELEEVGEGLFSPLMFSYYDLPSHLRQCFLYCAIFPKDYVIEKKELIELWMAEGFLKETRHRDMEMVGEDNFNDLSIRFFFQDFEMDENGGIIKCKMHDMVHDFAVFLTRGECLTMESSSSSIQSFNSKARHLFLMMDTETIPSWVYNAENLHTLLIESNGRHHISHAELLKLFDELKCLRILKCPDFGIEKCPKQIGKLIQLRHLDLSKNGKFMELPEAVCDLYNLLILDISGCSSLKRLPRRMGNLINLLHLRSEETFALNFMPKGMEKLTGLKTLNKFVVTRKGAALSDLGNLNDLRGTLEIEGLGIVRDVREAEKAKLQNKKGLTGLTLLFGPSGLSTSQAYESSSLVLEALKPPSDLKTLKLYGDEWPLAAVWPRWILSLTNLKELAIEYFENAEQLPPLGKLPSLESLYLCGMQKVKKVGVEFLGIETSSSSSVVAFPNLKSLTFECMEQWELWGYGRVKILGIEPSSSSSVVAFPILKSLTFDCMEKDKQWEEWDYGSRGEIMPRLSSLTIKFCLKLKMLPEFILQNTTLQKLEIQYSSDAIISNSRIRNKDVKEEKEILGYRYATLWAGFSWMPFLTKLKKLHIANCSIEYLPPLGKLPSLESVQLASMEKVKKVGVEFLGIETSSSSSVVAFPNLKSLTFALMEEWEEWDYGSRGEIMPRLSSLRIDCCLKLKMLPKYILQNTTLQELEIRSSSDAIISNLLIEDYKTHTSRIPNMDVEEKKEIVGHTYPTVWVGSSWIPPLTNLKEIYIRGSTIEHLPPLGKLPSLESLQFEFVRKVKKVGVEFLGIEPSLFPSSSSVVAFPNLKSLTFIDMMEWEEWDYGGIEENITIMPRLSRLTIRTCRKLKMFLKYILQNTTLQNLEIDDSPIISKCCKEDDQAFINRIPYFRVDGKQFWKKEDDLAINEWP